MSRVLVTGGAGGIGLHLVRRLLADGHEVDVVDDFSRGRRDEELAGLQATGRAEVIELDLASPGAPDRLGRSYRQVYHLAAIVGVAAVLSRPYAVLHTNVAATLAALEVTRRQRALDRLVFASSSEVHDQSVAQGRLGVPTPPTTSPVMPDPAQPRSSYALSKLYGEALCFQSGVPWTILRIHNAYGPRMGMDHVIPQLIRRVHETADDEGLVVRSPDHTRTFCYVHDVVEMMVRAGNAAPALGAVLNVGAAGPEVAIRELAALVMEAMGRRLPVVAGPPDPGSPPRRRPLMTHTEGLLGYRARVPLAEGIAATVAWYRAHAPAGA